MARKGGQAEKLLEAHLALGVSLFYAGKLVPARTALRRGLRLRQAVSASSPVFRVLDPAIVIRTHLAFVAWLFGDEAELREHRDEMWHQARELGQPLSLAYAHIGAVMLHQFTGDAAAVRADAEALLTAGAEQGFALLSRSPAAVVGGRARSARARSTASSRSGRGSTHGGDGGRVSRAVPARPPRRRAGGAWATRGRARDRRGGLRSRGVPGSGGGSLSCSGSRASSAAGSRPHLRTGARPRAPPRRREPPEGRRARAWHEEPRRSRSAPDGASPRSCDRRQSPCAFS